MKYFSMIGVTVVSLMLSSCKNVISESGVYYNVGLAEASNNLLLTNIIRSAKGYPNYYSVIGDYSGGRSFSSGASLGASIPLDDTSQASIDLGVFPSASVDRNANVASLETREFTRAMHTQVSPELFSLVIGSHNDTDTLLVLTLLLKTIVISLYDYEDIVSNARHVCKHEVETLTGAHRGICLNFETSLSENTCPRNLEPETDDTEALIRIYNDATNTCAFTQFRILAEALTLSNARIIRRKDGKFDIRVDHDDDDSPTHILFETAGTGFNLRSPNGIILYLGEIVRDQFIRDDAWAPELITRTGDSVPIFTVESGSDWGRAAVSTKIDNEVYWIRSQELGKPEDDFSYRALAVVKQFQALNTAQDQLPESPTIILGPR